jgi:N-acetylmuramoyl-L-alanine amidase
VSEQPEIPSDAVPEVKPTEHIAPEDPPLQLAAIDEQDAPEQAATVEPTPEVVPETALPITTTPLPRQSARVASKPVRQERHTLVTVVSALRALILTFSAAVIASSIFMWFTTPEFLSARTRQVLGPVRATAEHSELVSTTIPTPFWFKRIGVVAGHSGIATYGTTKGNVDSGAVCQDGFTEASVTLKVAQQVVAQLQGKGYTAEMLDEFDLRLDNYQAAAFISLHADSCEFFDDGFNHSGFKSTYPLERETVRDQDVRLNDCIRNNYGGVTGLQYSSGGITPAMTNYHAFHAVGEHPGIAPSTPGVILELGLLSYDRDLLQNHTDKSATGVVNGLLCFLEPKEQPALSGASAPIPTPTPNS